MKKKLLLKIFIKVKNIILAKTDKLELYKKYR